MFQFLTKKSSETKQRPLATTMDTRTVPTDLRPSARFQRVRRAALWFNQMWPGSLAEEANGYWLTHGPEGRHRLRWRTTFVRAWMLAGLAPSSWTPRRWGHACRRRAIIWAWLPVGAGFGGIPTRLGAGPRGRQRFQYAAMAAVLFGFAALALPSTIGLHNGSREAWRAALLRGVNGDGGDQRVGDEASQSPPSPDSTSGGSGAPGVGAIDIGSPGSAPDMAYSDDVADGIGVFSEGARLGDAPTPTLLGGDGPKDGLTFLDSDFAGDLGGAPGANNPGGVFAVAAGSGGSTAGNSGGGSTGGGGGSAGGGSGGGSTPASGGGGAAAGPGSGSPEGGSGGGLGGAAQIIPIADIPDDASPPPGSGSGGSGGGGPPTGGPGAAGPGIGGPTGPPPPGIPNRGPNGGNPQSSGTGPVGLVPEPSAWITLIAGFGLMGAMLRRRRAATAC